MFRPATMTNPSLEPGEVLQGTYRVVGRIATGGMGDVYEVSHARLAGRYALKLLRASAFEKPGALARFRREAQIVSGLRHPNVVSVIDFDQAEDGRPYLVMELLEGESLESRLQRVGRMTVAETMPIVRQIAAALSAAHAVGIVHRDLKPANVLLVRADGHQGDFVKLVDFGVAKAKNPELNLTTDGMLMGTPHYLAPEQARGEPDLDGRVDEFALAAIVYEMLSGEIAFEGDDIASVVFQITQGEPPRLSDPGGWLNPRFDAALRRALAKEPSQRFASVAEFVAALDDAATAPPSSAVREAAAPEYPARKRAAETRATRVEAPERPPRGKTVLVAAAGAGLIAAVTIAGVLLRREASAPPLATPAAGADQLRPSESVPTSAAADTRSAEPPPPAPALPARDRAAKRAYPGRATPKLGAGKPPSSRAKPAQDRLYDDL
jgi:eukaryotic-like serine/threonine-protein kinase